MVFSQGQGFITNEVETDYLGHRPRFAVAKMASDSIADHIAQTLDGLGLSSDGMPERERDITAVGLVLPHLKNDLTHGSKLASA